MCGNTVKAHAQADPTPEESQKLAEFLATNPTNGARTSLGLTNNVSHFILPAPFVFLGLLLIDIFVIRSIPVRRKFIADAKEKIKKKAIEERVLPNHIVDVPCKLKRFFAEMLLEYNMVAVEYVSENGSIRLWDESGNHKLFKKDFCGEAYEKEIEYLGTEVEANKFYNTADLITEKAEK